MYHLDGFFFIKSEKDCQKRANLPFSWPNTTSKHTKYMHLDDLCCLTPLFQHTLTRTTLINQVA